MNHKLIFIISFFLLYLSGYVQGQTLIYNPNIDDKTYRNPIIHADYSDPDAIRVGDDFYMVSSSFSHFPGLPILHSVDLINWVIIGHAALQYPDASFSSPQHGDAIWA
ncbi:MAG: family 43 glycosylhydrolase, partial [Saprospiraceae bacterium]